MPAYDVIIVGAGSAGCVLAARMSADPGRSVLLLEAGPDYPDPTALPPDVASSLRTTGTHDWGYVSEPGLLGRELSLPRGKLVGGCSAINGAVVVRGLPSDYDAWAALGNPGWSFAEVLPIFRQIECDNDFDDEWHGQNGPLPVRRYSRAELTTVQAAFLDACAGAGYPLVPDHNAPGAMGAGPWPMNRVGAVRQSAALTYLLPARGRPNLAIRSNVLVDRVLFHGRRAIGVHLTDPAEDLWAERVVLAAGVYGSPAILMRSGLGPADHLQSLSIPILEDRPGVGRHLRDHVSVRINLQFAAPRPASAEGIPWYQVLLTLPSSPARQGYDLKIFPKSIGTASPAHPAEAAFELVVALVQPKSQGQLRLRSADPVAPPLIDPGYLTHPGDLPRLVDGVQLARQLAQTPPLADLVLQELVPGPAVSNTTADLEAVVRERVGSFQHPVGTCRMGPAMDERAVVDAQGQVHGIAGLSVIDASIMPTIPVANTHLPTLMIAERCAAWLIEQA